MRIYAGLHDAAARGDVAEIEKLVAEGEKPDIQDGNSRTPLHVAVFRRHHAAARALLRLGADPNALDAQSYDIVTIAAVDNDLEMLKIALEGGGNPRAITSPYDGTALIAAAHRGHVEVVRALIAAKAPLNHVNNLGWTALLEAVVLGNGGGTTRRSSRPWSRPAPTSRCLTGTVRPHWDMPAPAAIRRSRASSRTPVRADSARPSPDAAPGCAV